MSESIRTIVEVLGPESITSLVEATNKIAVVAGELGVEISADEIVGIESVRLHVLADQELNLAKALEELRNVPTIAARLKEVEDARRVAKGHEEATAGMRPEQKLTYARKHGLTTAPKEKLTASDHAAQLSKLTGKAKLDYARRHGLA